MQLIDGCSSELPPHFQWYRLTYVTEIKSIQLHDSIETAMSCDTNTTIKNTIMQSPMATIANNVRDQALQNITKIRPVLIRRIGLTDSTPDVNNTASTFSPTYFGMLVAV